MAAAAPEPTPQLTELRSTTGDTYKLFTDMFLLKFLVAGEQNVTKTTKMLEDYMAWRKESNVDAVMDEYFGNDITHAYPTGFAGQDRAGNPVYIERPGSANVAEMFNNFAQDWLIRWHICIMESGRKRYTESGGSGIFVVMDVEGMGYAHLDKRVIGFVQAVSFLDQNYYPEHLAFCYIINAGWIFTTGWKLVSVFLNERTRKKIKILGGDYKAELHEKIDPDQLPLCFGGTRPNETIAGQTFGSTDPTKKTPVPQQPEEAQPVEA